MAASSWPLRQFTLEQDKDQLYGEQRENCAMSPNETWRTTSALTMQFFSCAKTTSPGSELWSTVASGRRELGVRWGRCKERWFEKTLSSLQRKTFKILNSKKFFSFHKKQKFNCNWKPNKIAQTLQNLWEPEVKTTITFPTLQVPYYSIHFPLNI